MCVVVLAFRIMAGLDDLKKLSLISKICTELENNTEVSDPDLGMLRRNTVWLVEVRFAHIITVKASR